MSNSLSEHGDIDLMVEQDIGGTNAQNDGGWLSMKNYARALFYVELGTWDSGDDLDECRIQQATDSSGTSAKDLTTDASGGNYDTDNPIDADGDFVIVEIRGEDMDADNGFDFIRGYVAEGGNSGVDNVMGVLIRYGYAYPKKELQGAASTGSKVYVSTGT
jgi:hypothetical protein